MRCDDWANEVIRNEESRANKDMGEGTFAGSWPQILEKTTDSIICLLMIQCVHTSRTLHSIEHFS